MHGGGGEGGTAGVYEVSIVSMANFELVQHIFVVHGLLDKPKRESVKLPIPVYNTI